VTLTVLLGGARAGKSSAAVSLASGWAGDVVFVATAEAGDAEMAARIARHRAERPESWRTVEEPLEVADVLASLEDEFAIVDCVTLWVANLTARGDSAASVRRQAQAVAATAAASPAPVVVVTNEVGLGIVPSTASGRSFRDLLGTVNQELVAHAQRAALVVAGRLLPLDRAFERDS
jgi:adenosyl cobinamide kinase/adenosyl cobinamide phosphate guanylyltransferase